MFLGRQGTCDPNATNSPNEHQPSPQRKRDNKRRRGDHSTDLHAHARAKNSRSDQTNSSQFLLPPSLTSSVQSLQHDGHIGGTSLDVAAATTADSSYSSFDGQFHSRLGSEPQVVDLAMRNTLTPTLHPLMNSIVPNLEPQVTTAMDLMLLEQLWTAHSQSAAFPTNAAAAQFFGSPISFAATFSPSIAADGVFDHEIDSQLAQFGRCSNNEQQEEPFLCDGGNHASSLAQIQNHVAGSSSHRRRTKSDNRDSATGAAEKRDASSATDGRNSKAGALTLCIARDKETLNENQIYLRQHIEAFRATEDDLGSRSHGKAKPITMRQVGVRCRHCSHLPVGRRNKGSTYFPKNRMGIYQAAQNISVEHLQSGLCPALPADAKDRFSSFTPRRLVASGGGKKYWADAAGKLGLVHTDDGIRFAADLHQMAEIGSSKRTRQA